MSKYIFDDSCTKFDIEDALTITKGIWADNNPNNENRLGLFVTSDNENYEVSIANRDSYVCGVTVENNTFLGTYYDSKHCVVQSLGVCAVKDNGTLVAGDKCMPDTDGKAILSSNNLGYRVVGRVDDTHVNIIIAPNNDMIQRIKKEVTKIQSHIGQVIQSTKLDTMEKVIEIYGGTNWELISGRFLVGVSSDYPIGTVGGEATHTPSGTISSTTLTVDQIPSHNHSFSASGTTSENGNHRHGIHRGQWAASGNQAYTSQHNSTTQQEDLCNYAGSHTHTFSVSGTTGSKGGSTGHNHTFTGNVQSNIPPYKAVYMWERIA